MLALSRSRCSLVWPWRGSRHLPSAECLSAPSMTVAHMIVPLSALSLSLSLRRLGIWLSVALGDPRSPPQLAASLWLCGPAGSLALTLAHPELVLALSRSR